MSKIPDHYANVEICLSPKRTAYIVFSKDCVVYCTEEAGQISEWLDFDPSEAIDSILGAKRYRAVDYERILLNYGIILSKSRNKLGALEFLRRSIRILIETRRRFVDKPSLLEDMVLRYWHEYSGLKEQLRCQVDDRVALDVLERYLELCASDRNQEWCDRQKNPDDPEKSFNREEEIEKIVYRLKSLLRRGVSLSGNGGDSVANDEDETVKKIKQALRRAQRWLVSRYNLTKAREIEYIIQGGGKDEKLPWPLRSAEWVSNWGIEVLSALVFLLIFLFLGRISEIAIASKWILIGIYFCAAFLLSFPIRKASSPTETLNLEIHLPRLAAGIVVGYFLLLCDETWASLFTQATALSAGNAQLNLLYILAVFFLPLLAVFVYVLVEMNNVSGIKYPLFRKSARLMVRGFAYSVLIGTLTSELFGEGMVARVIQENPYCRFMRENGLLEAADLSDGLCAPPLDIAFFKGAVGNVYPEAIVFLAPLALFIGIFIQLLWQEKRLTEKI